MQQELISEKVESGFIHARVVIEMAGTPKEHVEKTLEQYVVRLKESHIYIVVKEEFQECVEQGELWSTFVELELLVKGLSNFVGFCFDFMPSSVEVIAPNSLHFSNDTVTSFLNDLQGKLHALDMVTKQKTAESQFLKKNFNNIVRNLIAIVLYNKELTLKQASTITGIPEEELGEILKNLIDEKKVQKKENTYTLVIPHGNENNQKEGKDDGEKQN